MLRTKLTSITVATLTMLLLAMLVVALADDDDDDSDSPAISSGEYVGSIAPANNGQWIKQALSGHLCRCGAQPRMVQAVASAAKKMSGDAS